MSNRYGEPLAASRDSPAAERNKQPIAAVLEGALPRSGLVLEIASGTGQHVEHFARTMPALEWLPTEPDADLMALLVARVRAAALPNLREPLPFDVLVDTAPVAAAVAVVCINMIHIAPAAATGALLRHSARLLAADAPLVLYGPFKRGGAHTAPSNAAFDASLRARDASWGVRDLDEVAILARDEGFGLAEVVDMPANNFTVIWRRLGQ